MDLREAGQPGTTRHPWELARVAALRRILAQAGLRRFSLVLEVGCGDGFASAGLLRGCPVGQFWGVDSGLTDRELAAMNRQRPGWSYVRSLEDVQGPPAELVLLLDVMEHVPDDAGLLGHLVDRHLAPGGHVLVVVPAYQRLYGAHDRFIRHLRRYAPGELRDLAVGAGLRPLDAGSLFASLLPLRAASEALRRVAPRLAPATRGVGAWRRGRMVSGVLERALRAESAVLIALARGGVRLPGLTAWTLCRKP